MFCHLRCILPITESVENSIGSKQPCNTVICIPQLSSIPGLDDIKVDSSPATTATSTEVPPPTTASTDVSQPSTNANTSSNTQPRAVTATTDTPPAPPPDAVSHRMLIMKSYLLSILIS